MSGAGLPATFPQMGKRKEIKKNEKKNKWKCVFFFWEMTNVESIYQLRNYVNFNKKNYFL